MTRRVARAGQTADVRRLRDDCGELRVARRDAEDVTAGGGEGPDREPVRIDSRQGRGERDRGLPVGNLVPDGQDLARAPTALTKMAVVEGEDGEPGVVESLREQVCTGLLGHGEAPGQDQNHLSREVNHAVHLVSREM